MFSKCCSHSTQTLCHKKRKAGHKRGTHGNNSKQDSMDYEVDRFCAHSYGTQRIQRNREQQCTYASLLAQPSNGDISIYTHSNGGQADKCMGMTMDITEDSCRQMEFSYRKLKQQYTTTSRKASGFLAYTCKLSRAEISCVVLQGTLL